MSLQLVATSTMGLESVVARELERLGLVPHNSDDGPGRTRFTGDFRDMIRANINLRSAGKVLIQLAEFDVSNDFDTIFDAAGAIEWENWMNANASILVEGRSVRSTITSVPALQRTVKKAIVNRLMKSFHVNRLPEDGPEYTVEISLLKDKATITLDTTGRGLHRRGYRLMNVAVPLRETIAAALIQLSVWNPDRPLIDPFCASGTIPIEAAMLGRNIAPGLKRRFAAQDWPAIDSRLWIEVRDEAFAAIKPSLPIKIVGSDIDEQAIKYAQYHAQRAGVSNDILFETRDFRNLTDDRLYGCIICNPPYGDRVGEHEQYRPLYESMPEVLANLPTWSHFIYTSWNEFESVVGQKATRRRKLFNSRIECTYFQFLGPRPPRSNQITKAAEAGSDSSLPVTAIPQADRSDYPESEVLNDTDTVQAPQVSSDSSATISNNLPQTADQPQSFTPVFAGLDDYSLYQVEEFGRCLQNRIHHLRRYPKRGILCYRLYDRDFPEVPLAIDLFEGKYLHIAEYERPDERSAAAHRMWLDRVTARAAEILEIDPTNVFLKRRIRQRGESQYEKLGESNRMVTVHEGGLAFLCNMTDYLDVGLFLDHRQTRDMVRREARGKRFLNLFCYTGAFTCYAADGGADSTVSVDLSPRYLDWARENMELNGFADRSIPGANHRYIKSDIMKFLQGIPAVGSEGITKDSGRNAHLFGIVRSDFDLCVCDPPTYSNSKSTESDWDVQRDHVELLRLLATRMKQGGVVWFSNNFKRFKFNETALDEFYSIREVSRQTVPDEYRNKRIHKCWRLIKK